jgi:hypothetical protein
MEHDRTAGFIGQEIAEKRANTIEGFQVKARVVKWSRAENIHDDEEETADLRGALSIVRDLLEMQGASASA